MKLNEQNLKTIKAICAKWSQVKGKTEVEAIGKKYGISMATVYRIWRNNKELCK